MWVSSFVFWVCTQIPNLAVSFEPHVCACLIFRKGLPVALCNTICYTDVSELVYSILISQEKKNPRGPDIYGKWISCSFFCFFLLKGGFFSQATVAAFWFFVP